MKRIIIAAGVALALPLSACSSSDELDEAVEVESVVDLRWMIEDSGVKCMGYEERDPSLTPADELAACGDGPVFARFSDQVGAELWAHTLNDLGADALVGEKWVISADNATLQQIQGTVGGYLATD